MGTSITPDTAPPSPILAVNQTPTSSPLAALLLGKQHPEKDRKQEIKWASKSQYQYQYLFSLCFVYVTSRLHATVMAIFIGETNLRGWA